MTTLAWLRGRSKHARNRVDGSAHASALRVATSFAVFATLWIVGSDALVESLVSDAQLKASIQTMKGTAFVLATGWVIYLLVHSQMRAVLRANATLRENVDRLRFISEHADVGHWHWDIASNELEWSAVCRRLYGVPADESLTVERFLVAVHPEDRAYASSILDGIRSNSSGAHFHAEWRTVWPDGSVHWIESIGSLASDGDGPSRVAGIALDITERKRLQQQLQDALAAANAASDSKSAFVANMSHEIRTPMTGVMGMLEALLRTPLSTEQRDHVGIALHSARGLQHVLNDVLDFSAVEAGRVSIDRQPFEVRNVLGDELAVFRLRAVEKGVVLSASVTNETPRWLLADVRRLRQILTNLIGNALKYTDSGSIDVRVSYDAVSGMMRAEVQDTGIGMSPSTQAGLFQPFFQADSSISRRFEGSGLGLAICRQLVDLMEGRIGVTSREGEGSTFWIEIPAPEGEAPGEAVQPQADTRTGRSLNVLAAEDNPTIQRIIRTLLNALGHEVTLVEDGAAAVREAAAGRFDAILMDVMMPVMDGPAAARAIRQLGGSAGSVPIIALTADVLFGKDGKYMAAGMTDYVAKPIDVAQLAAALQRAGAAVNVNAA